MSVVKPNPCCNVEANLSKPEPYEGRLDLLVRVCRVCGCRHFEAEAEPGEIGVEGAPI